MPVSRPNEKQLSDENQIKKKEMDYKNGILSLIWGSGSNAAFNIAGLMAFLLIVAGILLSINFLNNFENLKALWEIILPILGTILGFLFGHKMKSDD